MEIKIQEENIFPIGKKFKRLMISNDDENTWKWKY